MDHSWLSYLLDLLDLLDLVDLVNLVDLVDLVNLVGNSHSQDQLLWMNKFGGQIACLLHLGCHQHLGCHHYHQHQGCLAGQVLLKMSSEIIDSSGYPVCVHEGGHEVESFTEFIFVNGVFWWTSCLPFSPGYPFVPLMPGVPSLPVLPMSPRDVRWKDGVNTTCIPPEYLVLKGA